MMDMSTAAPVAAARLLRVLRGLPVADPPLVLAGVHTPEGARELREQTGRWPGLLGIEYCRDYGCSPAASTADAVPWQELNPGLVEHGEAGGLIRVLTHFPNPCRPELGGLRDPDADLPAILSPGTPARTRWLALLDEVAAGFHDLGRRGIPVLYGPLHEMNCSGFWWGLDHPGGGPGQYRSLWRDAVGRIRDHNGCDNVLWLWAPLAMTPLVPEAYPGDDVVDVVGLDVYASSIASFAGHYRAVSAMGKPFILSEFGPSKWDATEPPRDPPYRCPELLREIRGHWPLTAAFMFWGDVFLPTRQQDADLMMQDPGVVDRDRLASMR